jgi:hypothetical protein
VRELAQGSDDRRVLFVVEWVLKVVAVYHGVFAVCVVGFVGC